MAYIRVPLIRCCWPEKARSNKSTRQAAAGQRQTDIYRNRTTVLLHLKACSPQPTPGLGPCHSPRCKLHPARQRQQHQCTTPSPPPRACTRGPPCTGVSKCMVVLPTACPATSPASNHARTARRRTRRRAGRQSATPHTPSKAARFWQVEEAEHETHRCPAATNGMAWLLLTRFVCCYVQDLLLC
jgi:hypothetical protein